jgi:hypothetical protein
LRNCCGYCGEHFSQGIDRAHQVLFPEGLDESDLKFPLSSGCRKWAPCITQDRKGAVYSMGGPLYPVRGYSNFLFMR